MKPDEVKKSGHKFVAYQFRRPLPYAIVIPSESSGCHSAAYKTPFGRSLVVSQLDGTTADPQPGG